MSCLRSGKDKYESSLVRRFLERNYGSDAGEFILAERPDLQPSCGGRLPRNEGLPDFVYQKDQQVPNLVVELGRWNEGEKELWFEKRVESFGEKLTDQLGGKLAGFYVIGLPYDMPLPKGKGKVKALAQLLNRLVDAILSAISEGKGSIDGPISAKLVKIDGREAGVFVTPVKKDFLRTDDVFWDPVYLDKLRDLVIECNRKFTGFENDHNVLVLDVTDSKMDIDLLTTLAWRQWDLDSMISSLAPRLKEIHLCEGMRVWSGAGGRLLRHKYHAEVPFKWMRLWPRRIRKAR